LLKHSSGVSFKANVLHDPESRTWPDAVSGSRLVGLEGTKEIMLDGKIVPDTSVVRRKGQDMAEKLVP
jgi:hypothetical protein